MTKLAKYSNLSKSTVSFLVYCI
ncbi:hypothetical protein [Romboutsia sp. 1001285H_161024_C4]